MALRPPSGEVTALAWAPDGRALYLASGLDVWRARRDGAPPVLVATLADEANDRIVRLEPAVDPGVVVAMTAGPPGPDAEANARFWRVLVGSGSAREITARDFGMLAADRGPYTSERAAPLVDPSGRWELRVVAASRDAAVPSEAVVVAPAGGGAERAVAETASLPVDGLGPEDGRYTGTIADAGWAGASGTVVFVAPASCEEACAGPMFAVEADGSGIRRLASNVVALPRTWNGTQAAVEEGHGDARRVVVVDAASGERVELGPGAGPRWAPR